MSESGKSDRWNSLLETLGVPASEPKPSPPTEEAAGAVPPSPAAKPVSVSMLPPAKAKAAPKPKPAPKPAKSPSYWSRIAGALGLEVAVEPEPPTVEEPRVEAPRIEEPTVEEPKAEEYRPRERGRYESRRGREDAPQQPEAPPRSKLDEMFGPKEKDVDVFGLGIESDEPLMREPSPASEREPDDRGSVLDYDVPEESRSDLSIGAATSERDSGRDEQEREGRGRRRRRGRGRGRRGGFEGREEAPPRAHEAEIEPAGEDVDFDVDRDAEFDLDAELRTDSPAELEQRERGGRREREAEPDRYAPSGERRPREETEDRGGRSRRRRGRRGHRDRDEISADQPSPYGGALDEEGRSGPQRDQRAASARGRVEEDELDEDLHLDVEGEDDDGRAGDVPTHKKIPTWDEAVNILIDANMANRANSPDRDRGRGRGRR